MPADQTVGELGEFALIDAIAARLPEPDPRHVPLGPGDDAAVVTTPGGRVVVTVDMLGEGTHFRTDWSSAHEIGVKAAAANLADVVAMGAAPTSLVVGLALPPSTRVDWVLELADGLSEEARRAHAYVVGGDIVRAERVLISVTALGHLGDGEPVTRSGARPGGVVAYAGRLGYSAAGLMLLQRGFRSPRGLVNAHRAPQPDYARGFEARNADAMIDVSDGLIADLGHIAKASGVAIMLQSARITPGAELSDAALAFALDPTDWMLHGGEDHVFVAVFRDALAVPSDWTIIGTVAEGEGVYVDGVLQKRSGGWDHFG